ncbi:MAG TPA: DNA-3-methyladenine glycosylase [Candidatus Kapabacteria bacterium]|jgi:DNA-3-methyladenine glycosylase|nr:DNA-3-methyladenine glycosylase [Candidatus Kapabacteria bacterium]HOM04125.1 DNA-3-methyladenine glycosylase [Candidatus Kapabacteria bacterium]HPP38736.1 DNA-3-methyladenine glycosylase [Candidatus Kapabacteria bacterium]HPU23843.1 DNA-3-methyladenine glycosylase [Candidatus Kapabacteria bacterium]
MANKNLSLNEIDKLIPSEIFLMNTEFVAQFLLGKLLIVKHNDAILGGRISETEAYLDENDEASHSYRGKTQRNAAMFATGGTVYVYRSYGVHYCMNIVTESENIGAAVLIRSIIPLFGIDVMKHNRKTDNLTILCNGPGKLTQALGITIQDNFKIINESNIFLLDDGNKPEFLATKRIGISKSVDLPLRFVII